MSSSALPDGDLGALGAGEPAWTVHRLRDVLTLTFGLNRQHRPDTAAAAARLGVSQRTVQRWLHEQPEAVVRISEAHLDDVTEVCWPGEPIWTVERLALVLTLTFGLNRQHRPDTRAAAAELGVSQRTVQRWLHGTAGTPVRISEDHLALVIEASRPSGESLRQEELNGQYAREVISRLGRRRRRDVLPAWQDRLWLEPHVVAVLGHPRVGLRQVAAARSNVQPLADLGKRGAVLAQQEVPTRFHATVLTHAVLQRVDRWRVQAPRGVVKAGFTQTWTDDAPPVDLDALAVTTGVLGAPSLSEASARRRSRAG